MSHISSRSKKTSITSHSSSRRSASHRSCRSHASTEKAILEASTRKVELQCRAEALKRRLALDREHLNLQIKTQQIEHEKEVLDLETELRIEEEKLATLERFDESMKSNSASSFLQLPQNKDGDKEVRQWLQRYGGDSAQKRSAVDGEGENVGTRSDKPGTGKNDSDGEQSSSVGDGKPIDIDEERKGKTEIKKESEYDPRITNPPAGSQVQYTPLVSYPPAGSAIQPHVADTANEEPLRRIPPLNSQVEPQNQVRFPATHMNSHHMLLTEPSSRPTHFNVNFNQPETNSRQEQDSVQQPAPSSDVSTLTQLLIKQQVRASLPVQQIPVFSGDPLQFTTFMRAFEYAVEDKTTESRDRLNYLCLYTTGEPKSLVNSCLYYENPDEGYKQAKQILTKRFGDKHKIAQAVLQKAKQWPDVKEQADELNEFSLFMSECQNMMQANSALRELDNTTSLQLLVGKLPYRLKGLWRNKVYELQEEKMQTPTFKDLVEFVNRQASIVSNPAFGTIKDADKKNQNSDRNTKNPAKPKYSATARKNAYATTAKETQNETKSSKSTNTKPCAYCEGETKHAIRVCRKFAKLAAKEKSDFCFNKHLCFGCLEAGHQKKRCTNPELCEKCHKSHPTVLHVDKGEGAQLGSDVKLKQTETKQSEKAKVLTGKVLDPGHKNPKMTIVPVLVKPKKGDRCILTYAFLDNGCSSVFADPQLIDILNINTRKRNLLIGTLTSEEVVQTEIVLETLQVSNLNGDNFIDLPRIYLQDNIPITVADMPTQQDLQQWSHLSKIELPELPSSKYTHLPKVTLMIGSNTPAATMPLRTCSGEIGEPYAVYTPLGWAIYGIPGKLEEELVLAHFVTCTDGVEDLEQQFRRYVSMDFTENLGDHASAKSQEDHQFLEIASKTIEFKDGHYHLNLPFRNEDVNFPNNRNVAQHRAEVLKNKLAKDKDLYHEYNESMSKVINNGYAEMVPEQDNSQEGKTWYIPHHGVRHPQKKKLRIVYDCGATYQGTSLNKELLQGPDLTNSLQGVLLRFRQEPVAFISDIEGMFHQVGVKTEDRDVLRFLWWPDGNLQSPLQDYRMTVHLFGATSSPACANFALKQTAADNKDEFDDNVIDTINNNFYVDDCLKSTPTEESAVKLAQDLITVCDRGGFHLTKWVSNSKVVMDSIPEEERAETTKNLEFDDESQPSQKALGMLWHMEPDMFGYKLDIKDKPVTRRGMLSVICSLYDPLGFVSPAILPAKQMLQELCKRKVGWDDEVPEEIKNKWSKWLSSLPELENFFVPRCWKPAGFEDPSSVQLHHFCDASDSGYGVASYLRLTNHDGEVTCNLVMSKARVAPIKQISIPKMELTAATVAVKVDSMLKRELEVSTDKTVFWSDSQTVLKYIMNDRARYPVFVANRVSVIRDGSDPSQWRYVPTELNPADHASRGLSVKQLISKHEWLQGPDFLYEDEAEWPVPDDQPTKQEDPEEIPVMSVNAVMTDEVHVEDSIIDKLIEHFSSWNKVRRVIAWWLRLKQIFLNKSRHENKHKEKGPLTAQEIEAAEIVILKHVQQQSFPQELKLLQKQSTENEDDSQPARLRKGSKLANLDPQECNGLLRVGGRLHHAPIPEESKHQIILPKKHHITELIIRHVHENQCHHLGKIHTLSKIRQKYWIIGGGSAVKSVINRCIVCRKQRRKVGTQKMADLPAYRVQPGEPPFFRTGVDYFGPLIVKVGRTTKKRYGVMFTCLNSRAIHLEVAESLDTSSCISAIRRFIARRGEIRELHSDNGTNFVGSNKEMKKALEDLNQEQIEGFTSNQGIQWYFNAPAASHHGGVWERQIRTVRQVLQSILQTQFLKTCQKEEQLQTFLCEVEATVNSRPLTRMYPSDPNDLDVLTPNDLLLLRPNAVGQPGMFTRTDVYAKKRWRQMQYLANLFWQRWIKEYLPALQQRQKWMYPDRNLKVGDVVLIVDESAPRNSWLMGKVQKTLPDRNGHVRQALVKTKTSTLLRPISKLCTLLEAED